LSIRDRPLFGGCGGGGRNPVAELAPPPVVEDAAVSFDDLAGGDVVDVAGDQGPVDADPGGVGQGGGEHGGGVASAPGAGADVVADVAADIAQAVVEAVPDRDPAEIGVAFDPPQHGHGDEVRRRSGLPAPFVGEVVGDPALPPRRQDVVADHLAEQGPVVEGAAALGDEFVDGLGEGVREAFGRSDESGHGSEPNGSAS
jgi:hypothetical protein